MLGLNHMPLSLPKPMEMAQIEEVHAGNWLSWCPPGPVWRRVARGTGIRKPGITGWHISGVIWGSRDSFSINREQRKVGQGRRQAAGTRRGGRGGRILLCFVVTSSRAVLTFSLLSYFGNFLLSISITNCVVCMVHLALPLQWTDTA